MKNIKDLPKDIYALFNQKEHHEPSEANLEWLADNIKQVLRMRLSAADDARSPLRFSNLGRPDRQLWYQANKPEVAEEMSPKTFFKFLYGDMLEQFILFLAKEAGHDVRNEQAEIEVDGVKGHIDAIIDGVVTDVKSASPYSFLKFQNGGLFEPGGDPFGYIGQISGYSETLTPGEGAAFLVADKVHGDIAVAEVSAETTGRFDPPARIAHLKRVIASPDKPEKCYPDEPEGKSGNRKLGVNCSYCPFKTDCWSDANEGRGLRVFSYYKGPVFLTNIVREPDVPEIGLNHT